MSELIEKATRIKQSLGLDRVVQTGFQRSIKSQADSHHTVTWPEKSSAIVMRPEDIFNKSQQKRDLALYVHIPFCTGRCTYCQYTVIPDSSQSQVSAYLQALEREMELVAMTEEVRNSQITGAYIGGGTPTFLSPEQLKRLFGKIHSTFQFSEDAEFTIEASPETILGELGLERLKVLKEFGINRPSLGIQTFDDSVLASIRRRHNAQEGIEAINRVKEYFDNFNIDLIVGLPNQTIQGLEKDLDTALQLAIPSVTAYPLTIRPETPVSRLFQREPNRFPNEDQFLLMSILTTEKFKEGGYTEYPVWWFLSSLDHMYKQQKHKWEENGELVALGISGYSYINGCQYYNFSTPQDYFDSLGKGELPIWKGTQLKTREDEARRNLVLGIKCKVDKDKFQKRYGFSPEDGFSDTLKRLENATLVYNTQKEIGLTYAGRLFAEEVSRSFI